MKNTTKLILKLLMISLSLCLFLGACSTQKNKSVIKKMDKSTSKSTTKTSKKNKKTTEKQENKTETKNENIKKDNKQLYTLVFDDYNKIIQYSSDFPGNIAKVNELEGLLSIKTNSWVIESAFTNPKLLYYSFVDVNKDGTDEMLISSINETHQIFLTSLYYLNNNTPALLSQGFVAGHGGARSAFSIYQNGDIVQADWSSGTGKGSATQYQFLKGNNPTQINQQDFQLGQDELSTLFGKSESELLSLTNLEWKPFVESNADTNTQSQQSMNITEVLNGNFNSIAGTWKNSLGRTYIIKSDGTVINNDNPDNILFIDTKFSKIQDSELHTAITSPTAMSSASVPTIFIPKGTPISQIANNENDLTDQTKDRFYMTQYIMPAETLKQEIYYRIN